MIRSNYSPIVAAILVVLSTSSSEARLKHRYSFTDSANDSISNAHGTVVDAGEEQNYVYAAGRLDLSANVAESSNNIVEDAYVDLPNGIISAAASSGVDGAVSFETWASIAQEHPWQRVFDFGTSNNGEDTSGVADASASIAITPNSASFGNGLRLICQSATGSGIVVDLPGPFPVGSVHHVAAVFDHTNASCRLLPD
ncbi:MAG: hypothetical protein R3E01_19685 [Pirellulaceae bacterium]|nr:hypothetical protein [Planctomycetales bacterium]